MAGWYNPNGKTIEWKGDFKTNGVDFQKGTIAHTPISSIDILCYANTQTWYTNKNSLCDGSV